MKDTSPASFKQLNEASIRSMRADEQLQNLTQDWFIESCKHRYSYLFTWLGRPIIQFPQDLVAMQEIIWEVQPDLIIETGIAHGGSLVFYASLLEMMGGDGTVVGIDVEIRPHNRQAIEGHPMAKRITMIEGSSTDPETIRTVNNLAGGKTRILVALDSDHTHKHVLKELELYSPLVSRDSYLVVFDTVIEDMPSDFFDDRAWGRGNNPRTAVDKFLKTNKRFIIDESIEQKLLVTVAPGGYLKCIKD